MSECPDCEHPFGDERILPCSYHRDLWMRRMMAPECPTCRGTGKDPTTYPADERALAPPPDAL